jgi:hypothetical protein
VSVSGPGDRFVIYNGTAPIEVSPGHCTIYRLSRRRNQRLNHTIHMAAITQIRHAQVPTGNPAGSSASMPSVSG